jgi:hypothetical protein
LELVGVSERSFSSILEMNEKLENLSKFPIDWDVVDLRLSEFREIGYDFLSKALQDTSDSFHIEDAPK